MEEVLKQLGGGAFGTMAFLALAYGVKYLVARSAARNRLHLAEITATGKRDEMALAAEHRIYDRLERLIEQAESEAATLRSERALALVERDAARVDRDNYKRDYDEVSARLRKMTAAKDEALEDAFNTRTMAQGAQSRHDVEAGHLRAELEAARWREKALRIYASRLGMRLAAHGLPVPELDEHLRDEEPRRLTGGDDEA